MSGRTTAEMIADLLDRSKIGVNRGEAAGRLAELDAELVDLYAEHATLIEWRHSIDALLPLDDAGNPIPWEQVVAEWRAMKATS